MTLIFIVLLIFILVHCWDYRRAIVKKSKSSLENELKFSTDKLTKNFSNYSSWHYRSELLPRIFPASSDFTVLDGQKIAEGKQEVFSSLTFSFNNPNNFATRVQLNSKCDFYGSE